MAAAQHEKANTFRALHEGPRAFIMANAWDAGSARILAGLGFAAIGTSSWASGNVLGRGDHGITRAEALAHCRAIAGATDLPVSPDLENGFGATPEEVAETYRQAAAAGVVGASIEDAAHGSDKNAMFDVGEAAERVAAAVEATRGLAFPFLLTARADGFLHGRTDLDDVIRRLRAYEQAGADVLMALGLPDLDSVREVCAAVGKPFNFMVGIPGRSFAVAELEAAGVRRISLASSLYSAAMSGLIAAAREAKEEGTFSYVAAAIGCWDLDRYMRV
ncbi:MAG TPA: isocitrate lyase/phosphoenolpyruvate mutase family protein [Caulobacterales bacterium]|nr:isocitrate lyase/phosphoenolpyruvate mutase family protein [Caulobacterales bacterium]